MTSPRPTRVVGWLLLAAACVGTAWDALEPGDVPLAEHEWQVASSQLGEDYTGRLYDLCSLTQRDVAPWQPGYGEAHARLEAIGAGRRAALPPDGLLRVKPQR